VLDQGEDHPTGDSVRGALDPGRGELLLDDQLLDGARIPAPGPRPVRHHVAGLDKRLPSRVAVQVADAPDDLPDLVPDRLRLGRQVDRGGPADAAPRQAGHVAGRRLRVDDRLDGGGPAQVEVGIVLPGEADPAVHLDVELGVLGGSRNGQRRGDRRRVAELVAPRRRGAGSVPDGRRGLLGRHQHVGAMMLHRLEGGDRAAELLAHLGVLARLLGALPGDAGRLGGQDRPGQVG